MSEVLINSVKQVEKFKQVIPVLKRMYVYDSWYYIAGTLVVNMENPVNGISFISIDIEPIDDYESEIIREGLYWASKLYIKAKEPTCSYYHMALDNIDKYESIVA